MALGSAHRILATAGPASQGERDADWRAARAAAERALAERALAERPAIPGANGNRIYALPI